LERNSISVFTAHKGKLRTEHRKKTRKEEANSVVKKDPKGQSLLPENVKLLLIKDQHSFCSSRNSLAPSKKKSEEQGGKM